MKKVECRLQEIALSRDHKFTLEIQALTIGTDGKEPVNKLPFIGESGAGKSTLLNIIAAIEWPQQGHVAWTFPDGKTIKWSHEGPKASDARLLRRHYFGFAFQDSTLISHLQVRDNLSYPLLLQGYSSQEARERAWQALDRVLLPEEKRYKQQLFKQFPSRLSGGQRQRVALVQAMIHNPYVLFADEPTGSLDRATRRQVMQVLYDWVDEEKYQGQRLLLWVTHHENDPRDAGVEWLLKLQAGRCRKMIYKSKADEKKAGARQEKNRDKD